jgi:chromosome transmission fidelity protein 18
LPSLPPTSDPALFDDWDIPQKSAATLPSSRYSDELEALNLVQVESTEKKNQEGCVIQHRAWKLSEVFRSDSDYTEGMPR